MLATPEISRIQLCGQFAIIAGGRRVDADLPGRRGRLLVAYLAAHRQQPRTREQVVGGLWPDGPTDAAAATLTVLLSKTRSVLGHEAVRGRGSLQLVLPADAVVDVELATVALHEAESAVALGQWRRAWATVQTARYVTCRPFLPEFEATWVSDERHRLELAYQRALACYVEACLGIGGTELPAAERSARELVAIAPLAEDGYRLLMRTSSARGDVGAALRTYEQLRRNLADDLGTDPSPQSQALHQRLLRSGHAAITTRIV
jgi:DNA-binding SARP family transcriptional activator